MQRIASFCVDHTKLKQGMYLSRQDGDILTYDIRMCIPNGGIYLSNGAMHTFEHLFATYARNSRFSDGVIYVGPMGCRTGFYFLTRGISHADAIALRSSRSVPEKSPDPPNRNAATTGSMICPVPNG